MSKLVSKLPDGEANGLQGIAREMVQRPNDVHVVIAVVDCKKTETDHDTGAVIPHARVLWVEPVDGEAPDQAAHLLREAHLHRTGRVLPAAALADLLAQLRVDQVTGEIR